MADIKARVLHMAKSLAARGHHRIALALLDTIQEEESGQELAFLRGKIHAQLGNYAQAIREWESALRKAPDSVELKDAIRKARELQRSPLKGSIVRMGIVLPIAGLCILIVAIAAAYAAGRWHALRENTRQEAFLAELRPQIEEMLDSTLTASLDARKPDHREDLVPSLDAQIVARIEKQVRALQSAQAEMASAARGERSLLESALSELRGFRAAVAALERGPADPDRPGQPSLDTLMQLLKPATMDLLARNIEEAENAVASLRAQETMLRASARRDDAFRYRRIEKKRQEAEVRLADLKRQWELQVVPWLRMKESFEGR